METRFKRDGPLMIMEIDGVSEVLPMLGRPNLWHYNLQNKLGMNKHGGSDKIHIELRNETL